MFAFLLLSPCLLACCFSYYLSTRAEKKFTNDHPVAKKTSKSFSCFSPILRIISQPVFDQQKEKKIGRELLKPKGTIKN